VSEEEEKGEGRGKDFFAKRLGRRQRGQRSKSKKGRSKVPLTFLNIAHIFSWKL
jgi:hypothetical protein